MSDYQKGVWQRENKTLESQIKTLEHELDRKPSLNLEDDVKASGRFKEGFEVRWNPSQWEFYGLGVVTENGLAKVADF